MCWQRSAGKNGKSLKESRVSDGNDDIHTRMERKKRVENSEFIDSQVLNGKKKNESG